MAAPPRPASIKDTTLGPVSKCPNHLCGSPVFTYSAGGKWWRSNHYLPTIPRAKCDGSGSEVVA